MTKPIKTPDNKKLAANIKRWGRELGFQQVGISDVDLSRAEKLLETWLEKGFHGEMSYMSEHGQKRSRPEQLIPGTLSVISVRINYLPDEEDDLVELLDHPDRAYISRYALGRDYHKVLRGRLKKLAKTIEKNIGPHGYRVFVDSAPVLEKPLAQKAGLGWIGKHTNLINRDAGSWFFLGELFVDIPLPPDIPEIEHCGSCRKCIDICPTNAIVAPYELDARRCISYLTIELKGDIPIEFRPLIGNRIYGCDDCQLYCPWNKFAEPTGEKDFSPRNDLNSISLIALFEWTETEWKKKTEGSAIRRISYEQWLRNIAVALGNAKSSEKVIAALRSRLETDSEMVRNHVQWALDQHNRHSNNIHPARKNTSAN
ncbi:MAG: tRNA epoxyqueuosine(34) reductase QueG [Woeseia sp.]|nr:tRNA epoxyqueuosine(34) reductase QueG [Woeseia sp.]|tara:strand:+ start:281 stop:1393 length:1113 start_codon:yes stop_codon:yes gene_type:complete